MVGDEILSRSEHDPDAPITTRVVEEVFQRYTQVVELRVGGQVVRTTAEHPFWVVGRGWSAVHELQVGERLLAAFGANRMLMASDWPWIEFEPGYGRILAVVDELLPDITAAERDAIRGGTAMSLFRF